jgi:hypothetical protein
MIASVKASASGDSAGSIGKILFFSIEVSSDLSTSTIVDSFIERVDKEKKLRDFVDSNYPNIQKDAALGQGEYLEALYELGEFKDVIMKVDFLKKVQANYAVLFSKNEGGDAFIAMLRNMVAF